MRHELSEEAKEARRTYQRNYKRANAEKVNAYQKNWRKANPDKVKAYQENYWERKVQKGATA